MHSWLSAVVCFLTCGLVRCYQYEEVEAAAPLLASAETTARRRLDPSVRRRQRRGPLVKQNVLGHGQRDITADYAFSTFLGRGAFGVVRMAVHLRTGLRYAVKSIYKKQMRRQVDIEDLKREVQILGMLSSHPNVAALLQTYEDDEAVHIVLELAEEELFERVANRGVLTERDAAHFFRQMVAVVQHMHSLRICHRDIKPENFMLSDRTEKARIKACDFGLSQFFDPNRNFHSLVGSAFYVAPEVLAREYGPQADVWSLGVCLFTLLSGLLPFFGETEAEVFAMVQYADLDLESAPWPQISPAAKNLVLSMLQRDPARRIKPTQILQHPWLCEAAPDRPLDEVVAGRLARLNVKAKAHRAAMVVAASTLGTEDIRGLQALFNRLDADKSGRLSAEELQVALQRQGQTAAEKEAHRMIAEADTDGDGQVGLAELLSVTLGSSAESRTELLQVLFQKLRREQIPNAFSGLDTSAHGEGGTTFESFRRFMEQGPALQEAVRRRPHCFEQQEEDGSESVGHLSSEGAALEEWNT